MMIRQFIRLSAFLCATPLLSACSLGSLVDVKRPSTILDPDAVKSYTGAVAIYNGSYTQFASSFMGTTAGMVGPYVIASGQLADEYRSTVENAIDRRDDADINAVDQHGTVGGVGGNVFSSLSLARISAGQAISYLSAYAKDAPEAYLSNMYNFRGFSELFMSEMYCSGIPLSEAFGDGEVRYGTPLTTRAVLEHALTQFDSAYTFGKDSIQLTNLSKLGRARAYMNLNQYDKALTEVSGIPTSYQYNLSFSKTSTTAKGYFHNTLNDITASIGNAEGNNGLNFVGALDPRVTYHTLTTSGGAQYFPKLYFAADFTIPLASGIQARLIEAEVLLKKGMITEWLDTLNSLRTTCTTTATCPSPAPAGSGNIEGLALLADPGTDRGRILLTFREKGFWLFSQGHRQGDMRRLVKQYGMRQDQVYPTGLYASAPFASFYGSRIDATVGYEELQNNPNFHGCLSRD